MKTRRRDFLRTAAEVHAALRERGAAGAAAEQAGTQLLLQIHELAGERGLGHMQRRGGTAHRALVRHRQKIPKYTQFHAAILYAF